MDAEAFTGTDEVNTIVETAHLYGVKVIASNHDFKNSAKRRNCIEALLYAGVWCGYCENSGNASI